jgi:polyhydroxybutyrate depolymerase
MKRTISGVMHRFGGSGRRKVALLVLAIGCVALLFSVPPHSNFVHAVSSKSKERHTRVVEREVIVNRRIASTGCGKAAPLPAGMSGAGSLTSGGLRRTYWLHIPVGYRPNQLYPLVLNFHGHGSIARLQELVTGFSALADRMGFIVVYPQGAAPRGGTYGWASGGPNRPDTNDVLFVSDLLNQLQSHLCIDPDRIYATGFSNGGGFTSVLACKMALRIAAFASVSGSYYPVAGGCAPGRPVSILEFHGTADRTVPYGGRAQLGELSTLVWLQRWAARDGCVPTVRQSLTKPAITELEWAGCQDNAVVVHYRLNGGIHVWPGGARTLRLLPFSDQAINATQVIWDFFAAHPLPPPDTDE